MTRQQRLNRLQKQLSERRRELRKKINGGFDSSNPSRNGDEGDAANYNVASEMNTRRASKESDELRQIEIALLKFREGRYGICEASGKSIPIARLEALPFTRLSVEAQRQQEEMGVPTSDYTGDWETAVAQESRFSDREYSLRDLAVDD